jgi:hypothetical protein
MKNTRIHLAIALISILAASCKDETVLEPEAQFNNYFPAVKGSYIVYDCDSVVYDDFTNTVDTLKFKIKEYYETEFTDNSGRTAIRLERYKMPEGTTQWQLKDIWSLVKTDKQVEKVEEDVRMLKLLFPVKEGLEWDINALNNTGSRTVICKSIHQPYSVEAFSFDSTITVVNTDPENLVEEYRDTEVFAANKGMVYKKYVNLKYKTPPQTGIKSGVVFTMQAVEFGVE